MNVETDDKLIIERIKLGDENAFRYVFEHNYEVLCRFANLFLHDLRLAEEKADDVLCYFWEHSNTITINYSIRAYLMQAVKFRCINEIKSNGVPYDGKMTKADGKGKWWEGYDPQDLYVQNHPLSKGSWSDGMIHRQWAWGEGASLPSSKFVTNFYDRTLDVINRYNPDLLYFDVTVAPFYPVSDVGLKIATHFYNHNMATHKGKLEAVMFGKILEDYQKKAIVWDVERGAPNNIVDNPWQSCSCIGGWHYNTDIYKNNRYKSAADVVKLLIDIVSKNGNQLLNVPLRADGTFDEKEEKILNEFGDWMHTNSEAIYDTRPWKIFGEDPIAESDIKINAQGFNEGSYSKATAKEIRFTQRDGYLYATVLAWPETGTVQIKALSEGNELFHQRIRKVELLGYGAVKFTRTADALIVTLPMRQGKDIAPVLKIN